MMFWQIMVYNSLWSFMVQTKNPKKCFMTISGLPRDQLGILQLAGQHQALQQGRQLQRQLQRLLDLGRGATWCHSDLQHVTRHGRHLKTKRLNGPLTTRTTVLLFGDNPVDLWVFVVWDNLWWSWMIVGMSSRFRGPKESKCPSFRTKHMFERDKFLWPNFCYVMFWSWGPMKSKP